VPDVQLGDVYGALVSWCCAQGNTQQALQLASQALEQHGLQPQHFLDASVLDTLQVGACSCSATLCRMAAGVCSVYMGARSSSVRLAVSCACVHVSQAAAGGQAFTARCAQP
jgi:pentatricopeptide repeat protein